jgi:hypothetical protein
LLNISCKNDNSKSTNLQLIEKTKLISDAHQINVDLYRPSKIFIHNDKLIVYDDVRDDIFKVFDLNRLSYLYSFGNTGLAPGEFVFTDKESIIPSDYFEILDRSKLYYYHIMDTAACPIDSVLFVTNNSEPVNSFKKLSDSIYLFTNNGNSGKFDTELILYNTKQNTKENFGKVILFEKSLQSQNTANQASALIKSVITNQREQKIATFYYHYPYFKIYSDNFNYTLYHIQDTEQQTSDCIYFTEPHATERYIYVMWIAKSKKKIMHDLRNYRPQLLVFDWNGNLRHNYLLDIPVITFAVKNDDSQLYAVSFDEKDINTLFVYNLSKDDASVQLSNDLFSLNIMDGYHFLEKDKEGTYTSTEDGYKILYTYLGQGHKQTYPELESISVQLYIPQSSSTNPQTKIEEIIAKLRTNSENFQVQNLNKENSIIYHCLYSERLKEYDASESLLFFNSYLFYEDDKIIMLSIISTTPNVEQYFSHFENTVLSFKLK